MYYINIDILTIVNYSAVTCIQGPLNPLFVYCEMFTKAILEELLVYRYQYGNDWAEIAQKQNKWYSIRFTSSREETSIIPI